MRTILQLSTVILAIAISSCKGDQKELAPYKPDYYFRFKVDDSLVDHKNGLMFCSLKPNSTIAGNYDFQLSSNTNTSSFTIGLYKPGEITRGTYTDPLYLNAEYYIDMGMTMYSLHTTLMPPASFSVSLTQIEEKYIRGTFTGTWMYNEARTDSFRISGGEFLVRRTN